MSYINKAKSSPDAKIIAGGKGDKSKGYFIEPTVIVTENPHVHNNGRGDLRPGDDNLCL